MLQTLRFSLQNAIYFIMLPFLVHVLFQFYLQVCQNLNIKLRCQKVKHHWSRLVCNFPCVFSTLGHSTNAGLGTCLYRLINPTNGKNGISI